jgi:hypothetical protein
MKVVRKTAGSKMVVYGPPRNEAAAVRRAAATIRARLTPGQRRVLAAARTGRPLGDTRRNTSAH